MKTLCKSETDYDDLINSIRADTEWDRRHLDHSPDAYPCVVVTATDTNYFGERLIAIADIIYMSDFH